MTVSHSYTMRTPILEDYMNTYDKSGARAYLHLEQAPFDANKDRRAFGIGVVLEDGGSLRTYRGHGVSNDGDFPRQHAVAHLLSEFIPEDAHLTAYTKGLSNKVQHFRNGGGRRSDGSKFIGGADLFTISKAISDRRLTIMKLPSAHTPSYQLAKFAARDALRWAIERQTTGMSVAAIFNPNTMDHFAEVIA